jgi:fermentation-respiration switch protein FrsA (DUF1100 family)
MWQIFLQSLIIIASIYVALAIFLFFTQSSFVYSPTKEIVATPDQICLSFKTVSFKTPDGVELSGWFIPAASSRGVILFCHGNAGNISHRLESIEMFNRLRLSTFIFDYRGYGKSNGTPSEKGSYLDAMGAWNYLIEHEGLAPSDIILFGRSLGGAIACWLAGQNRPKALIIESTFTSVPDLAEELYFYLPVRWLCRYRYNTLSFVQKIRCPVLVIHSEEDEIVSFSHGRKLFNAAKEPKFFLKISGSHNEGFVISSKLYMNGIKTFLDKIDNNAS